MSRRRNGWYVRGILRRGFSSLFLRPGQKRLARWVMAATFVAGIVGVGLLAVSPCGCSPKAVTSAFVAPDSRTIRVKLLDGVDRVRIAAGTGPICYTSGNPTERHLNMQSGVAVLVRCTGAGWDIGGVNVGAGRLYIRPATVGSVAIEGVAYRGQYCLIPLGGGRFDVINEVEIDDYLKSVLSKELYPAWHENTYRALSIAARTYALYEKHTHPPRDWDLYADQRSQMYGGIASETPKSVSAVEATRGIVVVYGKPGEEHIFKTYYSSCCGGVTQNVSDAFPEMPQIPPLEGRRVGPLCSASAKFVWGPVVVAKDDLTKRLRHWGRDKARAESGMAMVQSVAVASRNQVGRPTRYIVRDVAGRSYMINCEDFRAAVNSEGLLLYSSNIDTIVNDSDCVRFIGGHGFGHGVGMCQYCAEARARNGVSDEDIVHYAYPGARLARAY